jgi:sugar-specific transcriptional regulator TrmB
MYEKILQQALLTKDQAIVYTVLLKNGPLPAGKLTKKTPLKRSLVYKVLEQLTELGLVEKREKKGQAIVFQPNHPETIKELIENRQRQTENARAVLETTMPGLVSDFNLISGKPAVRFFEGIEGLKQIYDDILSTGKDFYLIRSVYEPVYSEKIVPILERFIKKRVAKKISVTAITPRDFLKGRVPSPREDAKILYKRTWVDKKHYDAPVEIDIYGDKIAFLSFGKELIGVIIESPQIAKALKKLFLLSQKAAKQLSS